MKILWLSHIIPYPPKGGVLQRSYHLLRELAKEHEVHLFSYVQQEPLQRMYGNVDVGLNDCREKLSEIVPVVRLVSIPSEQKWCGKKRLLLRSLFTPDPYTVNWLKSPGMRKMLAEVARTTSYDAVHFDTISLAVHRNLFDGVTAILNHHNVESHMMLRRAVNERNPLSKCYLSYEGYRLQRYEAKMCGRFDANIMCSALDGERLKAIAPGIRTVVIPNGVDIDYFKPTNRVRSNNTLVFVGRFSAYTNRQAVSFLAEQIWPALKREIPEIAIDIVGPDPPRNVIDLGNRDSSFRVHGFVDDVRPFLGNAAVCVCPVKDGGGTKLKILDALAMGVPLVADPIACEGIDVVEEKSVLYASVPHEYVGQVKRLLANQQLQQKLSRNARRLVESRYAYASIGKKLCATYVELVGASRDNSAIRTC